MSGLCGVKADPADIAITTNGGYPLDQNVYQAVKGMTAAEATVKDGGVIIMLAESSDGYGGEDLYNQLTGERDITKIMEGFLKRSRNNTLPDQWQSQILVRILMKASVIYVSQIDDAEVEKMHMIPAHSVEDGISKAKAILKMEKPKIVAIPDGISVVVQK